jgi:hypothetical protein
MRAPEKLRLSCVPKRSVPLDVSGRTAIEAVENAFAVLRTKLVQQLVGADCTRLDMGLLLLEQQRHSLRKVFVVDDAGRSPHAGKSSRPPLPPPPLDDDEVMTAEDRAAIVACLRTRRMVPQWARTSTERRISGSGERTLAQASVPE